MLWEIGALHLHCVINPGLILQITLLFILMAVYHLYDFPHPPLLIHRRSSREVLPGPHYLSTLHLAFVVTSKLNCVFSNFSVSMDFTDTCFKSSPPHERFCAPQIPTVAFQTIASPPGRRPCLPVYYTLPGNFSTLRTLNCLQPKVSSICPLPKTVTF